MLALLMTLLLMGPKDRTPSVAMVLRIKGEVLLLRGKEKPVRVWALDLILPGDRLSVPAGGEAKLIVLDDGHTEILAAGKTATAAKAGFTPASAVVRKEPTRLSTGALQNLRDDIPSGRLGGGVLRARKPGETLPTLSPFPTATILTDRPTLTWPAVEGAGSYIVELSTGNDLKFQRRIWRLETKEPRLPFPEKQAPLQAVLHHWSVVARLKGDVEKIVVSREQGAFTVASPEQLKQLEAIKPLAASGDAADQLLAAGAYESLGVLDEAFRLYRQLAEKAGDARLLETLTRYYEAGGQPMLAAATRKKAEQLRRPGGEK